MDRGTGQDLEDLHLKPRVAAKLVLAPWLEVDVSGRRRNPCTKKTKGILFSKGAVDKVMQ